MRMDYSFLIKKIDILIKNINLEKYQINQNVKNSKLYNVMFIKLSNNKT